MEIRNEQMAKQLEALGVTQPPARAATAAVPPPAAPKAPQAWTAPAVAQEPVKTFTTPITTPINTPNQGNKMSININTGLTSLRPLGGIIRRAPGERLVKALESAKKISAAAASSDPNYQIEVFSLDNTQAGYNNLLYPALIIVALDKTIQRAAYHSLLIQQEVMLPDITESIGGMGFALRQLPSDVHNATYYAAVEAFVSNIAEHAIYAGAEVVPKEINLEDEGSMQELIVNGLQACVSKLNDARGNGRETVTAGMFSSDEVVQTTLSINGPNIVGIDGLPVRADAVLTTTVQQQGGQRNQAMLNAQGGAAVALATVAGYANVFWAPMSPEEVRMGQGGYYNPYAVPSVPTQKFQARFIATQMSGSIINTLEMQLMAMATMSLLVEGNNWWPLFNNKGSSHDGVDLREIGALTIEGNLENSPTGFGAWTNTASAAFTQQDLGDLLGKLIRPQIVPALSIPECGPSTWYNAVFAAAGAGHAASIEQIRVAADTLTGGAYSANGGGRSPLIVVTPEENMVERVHTGYCHDRNGNKRSIESLDYLAVMNLAGTADPTVGARWTDTFNDYSQPLIKRLADREKMITELSDSTVTFTGYSRIVNIDPIELSLLARAIATCGLRLRTGGALDVSNYASSRASYGYIPTQVVQRGATGFFHTGGGAPMARNVPGSTGFAGY